MTLGKEGVAGSGPDGFDRPTGVAVAANGDVFVADGHAPNKHNAARVVKFSKEGRFIKEWGRKGSAPGEFDEPHDIFVGGSRGWVYVTDRRNQRVHHGTGLHSFRVQCSRFGTGLSGCTPEFARDWRLMFRRQGTRSAGP